MKRFDLYAVTGVLAVVGIGLALYLFYEYLNPAPYSACYVNSTINCDASTIGPLANTLGIPTALWGLTGYVVILAAAFKRWPRVLLGMTTFGMLFCLRITYLEIFSLNTICPVCLACQVDMLAVFALAIALFRQTRAGAAPAARSTGAAAA